MTAGTQDFSVSVVIPLYNKENSIRHTIASVLRQSRMPDEILIVDDGSTDRSVEIAKRALDNCGAIPVKLLSQPNCGVSVARNSGADAASNRFVAFLDADDEWLPGYLAELEALSRRFTTATILTVRNSIRNPDGSVVAQPTSLPSDFVGILDRPLRRFRRSRGLINSSSVAVRNDAWKRCGGFPVGAALGEDLTLWLKLATSEIFAHSSAALSVFHPEHSEYSSRREVVDHQFSYFLGTVEGRRYLDHTDLRAFLASHLANTIFFRRLAGHSEVQHEFRRLALALPPVPMLTCLLVSAAPLPLLRTVQWMRTKVLGRARVSVT